MEQQERAVIVPAGAPDPEQAQHVTAPAVALTGFNISEQSANSSREDLGTYEAVTGPDGRTLMYAGPEGRPTPVTILLAGSYSSHYRRQEEAIRRRKLKLAQLTAEPFYEDQIDKAVACTLDWAGFFGPDAQDPSKIVPVPCTPHNVRNLYVAFPWLQDWAYEKIHEHERFFTQR